MQLGWGRRLGYGVGDMGINFYFASTTTYLMYFYTDVYGLSAAVAGWVLLVARGVDAITDPLMGFIADRTRTRWGKFRPYLLFGAVPLGLLAIATFYKPPFEGAAAITWAYATYILFGIAYTVVALPYAAMTPSLTDDYQERTTLSTVRMFCAFLGAYIVSTATPVLVGWFPDDAIGYAATLAIYSLIATALLWISFAATRETRASIDQPILTLNECVDVILANRPLAVVSIVFVCGMMAFTVRMSAVPYYFKYYLERPDLIPLFFGIMFPLMIVALLGVPPLARVLGKAGAVVAGAVVTIIGAMGLWLTPSTEISLTFFFAFVIAIGGSPIAVLGWAMIGDTIDYAEWKTGLRGEGVTYAFASFFQKLAKALGGGVGAMVLAFSGYVANTEPSKEALQGIVGLMTWVPVAIMVVLIVAVLFYRLDAETHRQIIADLRARSSPQTAQ